MREIRVRNLYGVQYPSLRSPEFNAWVADITPTHRKRDWDTRNLVAPLNNPDSSNVVVTATSCERPANAYGGQTRPYQDRLTRFLDSYEDPRTRIPLWVHFDNKAYILAHMHGNILSKPDWLHTITITGMADVLLVPEEINDIAYRVKEDKIKAVLDLEPIASVPMIAQFSVSGNPSASQLRVARTNIL